MNFKTLYIADLQIGVSDLVTLGSNKVASAGFAESGFVRAALMPCCCNVWPYANECKHHCQDYDRENVSHPAPFLTAARSPETRDYCRDKYLREDITGPKCKISAAAVVHDHVCHQSGENYAANNKAATPWICVIHIM